MDEYGFFFSIWCMREVVCFLFFFEGGSITKQSSRVSDSIMAYH